MKKTESIEDFYQQKKKWMPPDLGQHMGHFNIFDLADCNGGPVPYNRREFYKVSLIRGNYRYHYADKSIEVSGSTLIFFNPQVPYTWEMLGGEGTGCFCIFTAPFFTGTGRNKVSTLPMFAPGSKPAYFLNAAQDQEVSGIFRKMFEEIKSDYVYKYDLLRTYVMELIHLALKMQPADTLYKHPDANSRITSVFTELLERQFPIETPSQRFSMRSAKDFANELAVHVNHLNRAIKETTGKTTTDMITERVTTEAKSLLRYTDWNISEIAYSLGFEEPAHFSNFFRKQTGQAPAIFRNV
ncbi:helix-turn-helix domain-containing protein [Chitinophaga vietnamensis]|uniref:helix-turn-helix domain-containing protein n=1 Tax=Chitinophaga vietnamensis TaxID=2593957 RepID=UPI0011774D72|nr:AraC family transcriptional regulator [Chitinophaga vietnamensis]